MKRFPIAAGLCAALVMSVTVACGGAGNSCSELEAWYADNPYDSNVDIAKDYYRLCNEVPPPVINGELTMDDIT